MRHSGAFFEPHFCSYATTQPLDRKTSTAKRIWRGEKRFLRSFQA